MGPAGYVNLSRIVVAGRHMPKMEATYFTDDDDDPEDEQYLYDLVEAAPSSKSLLQEVKLREVLQGFVALAVVVAVVVFQDDLRRLFEQIGRWGVRVRPRRTPAGFVDVIVRTVAQLAGAHRGALLVFPGGAPLERHLEDCRSRSRESGGE